jgi:hypothetical protein
VPEDVALLGVDNDLTICALGSPPISSIDNPAEEVGFQAAGILSQMMAGQKVGRGVASIQPVHVVERPSTDRFAVDDALVQKAIAFLKRNLREVGMGVVDVSEYLGVSRRSLERVFFECSGDDSPGGDSPAANSECEVFTVQYRSFDCYDCSRVWLFESPEIRNCLQGANANDAFAVPSLGSF